MSRAFPIIAVILIVLLVSSLPAQAAPVRFTEVIQVINGLQNPSELRMRGTYSENAPLGGVYDPMQSGAKSAADNSTSKAEVSLLTGIAVDAPDTQSGAAVVVTQGEVDGTVCDCGDVWVPGGFPRWPLLLLAGIPLIFIDGDDGDNELPPLTPEPPIVQPSPTPPTNTVPEPTSLLLFGTGLVAFGASVRRRYVSSKLAAQRQTTEEG